MSRSILDVGVEVSVTIGTCLLDLASYTVVVGLFFFVVDGCNCDELAKRSQK